MSSGSQTFGELVKLMERLLCERGEGSIRTLVRNFDLVEGLVAPSASVSALKRTFVPVGPLDTELWPDYADLRRFLDHGFVERSLGTWRVGVDYGRSFDSCLEMVRGRIVMSDEVRESFQVAWPYIPGVEECMLGFIRVNTPISFKDAFRLHLCLEVNGTCGHDLLQFLGASASSFDGLRAVALDSWAYGQQDVAGNIGPKLLWVSGRTALQAEREVRAIYLRDTPEDTFPEGVTFLVKTLRPISRVR